MNINVISNEPAYVYVDFTISNISENIVIYRIYYSINNDIYTYI